MSFELWIMFHDGMPMIHKGCIYCHSTKYTTNDTTANVNKHKRMCTDVVENCCDFLCNTAFYNSNFCVELKRFNIY